MISVFFAFDEREREREREEANRAIQVVTLVIFYSLVLLMIKKPFRHPEANMMQFWVNVQSVMVMVGAFIYQSESSTVIISLFHSFF